MSIVDKTSAAGQKIVRMKIRRRRLHTMVERSVPTGSSLEQNTRAAAVMKSLHLDPAISEEVMENIRLSRQAMEDDPSID